MSLIEIIFLMVLFSVFMWVDMKMTLKLRKEDRLYKIFKEIERISLEKNVISRKMTNLEKKELIKKLEDIEKERGKDLTMEDVFWLYELV